MHLFNNLSLTFISFLGLMWKVYSGFKKSTKQPAAIFVLEKRALDRFDRQDRELLLDLYRKAISQLTRLRHPQVGSYYYLQRRACKKSCLLAI